MLPASVPYLNDLLGRYYRFYHPSQGPRPISRPMWFGDNFYAHQFLIGLDCDPDFWLQLLVSLGDSAPPADPCDARRRVADWIAEGRVQIYPSANPAMLNSLSGLTRFRNNRDSAWALMPAANATKSDHPARSFVSLSDAKAFVQSLNPSAQQLKATGKLLPAGQWQAQAPLQSIAQALHEGELVVVEEPIQTGAGKPGGETNLVEELLEATAGNAPATLGPHADDSGDGAHNDDPVEEIPVCELQKFMLRCTHYGSRGYMLDVLNGEPNMNGTQKVLQVITQDDRPDKITVDFAGACGHGKNACPSINLSGPDGDSVIKQSGKEVAVLPPSNDRPVETFSDFLRRYLLPGDIDFNTYRFSSSGCSEIEQIEGIVQAFPMVKWEGGVKAGYSQSSASKSLDSNEGSTGDWALSGKVSGQVNTHHWELGSDKKLTVDDCFPEIRSMMDTVTESIEKYTRKGKNRNESNRNKVELTWPTVELKGGVELKEVEQRNDIAVSGSISLSMTPLLKADVCVDILDTIISLQGPHSTILKEIRERAQKGIGTEQLSAGAVVALDLLISGELSGSLSWEKNAGKRWLAKDGVTTTNKSALSLLVGVEARIEAKAKIFYVEVRAGMVMSLKSAGSESKGIGAVFELTSTVKEGEPAIGGSVLFTGAALYYTYYAEVAKGTVDSKNAENEDDRRRRGRYKKAQNENLKEKEMKRLREILPEARFPREKKEYSLNEAPF
ncbi:hypothetical protein EDC38_2803 [Marinimicrobium koreense]|uniref:Uncharacterized protein n=1 Tax=Marinimicrobium koreense TaxID=306545 RepID=A0A3N1NQT7_9GAMM|nr:hypothetical protein [Marinimicrobium koreense]ROQ18575.1 hypothetical protein EDC38_2803 [Marinimicrobium koreense]